MFINFHANEFQDTLPLIGNMSNKYTLQYLTAVFGLNSDFLPMEPLFERHKNKKLGARNLEERDFNNEFEKY